MTREEKQIIRDSCCITDEQRKEWNKKIAKTMSELTTGGINFGYESPVNIIMGQVEQEFKQIQNETENTIMAEIRQQLGVYVDKEELIKALQYDRNQYDKGYSDGRASIVEELEKIKGKIIACTQQEEGEVPACINYGIKLSTEIVEKHIAELKGKQE